MCDERAAGREHVPPLCLFPEKKDLPKGADLRKQLITVPACDEHNMAKSKDDENLLYLLVISISSGEVAKNHFFKKIMRAINRKPALCNDLLKIQQPVVAVDEKSGEAHNTAAVTVDDARLDSVQEHTSRAIYFHHFEDKWQGEVKIQVDFLLTSLAPLKGEEINQQASELVKAADSIFCGQPFHGENKEVFKYQVVADGDSACKVIRLHFYEGSKVTAFFE